MFLCVSRAFVVYIFAVFIQKICKSEGRVLGARSATSSPQILLRLPLSRLCTLCVSREAAVHKCIAARRRGYRLYIYRLSAHRTHGCPADTRVSYLKRIHPAERDPTPKAADEPAGERAQRAQTRDKSPSRITYTARRVRSHYTYTALRVRSHYTYTAQRAR